MIWWKNALMLGFSWFRWCGVKVVLSVWTFDVLTGRCRVRNMKVAWQQWPCAALTGSDVNTWTCASLSIVPVTSHHLPACSHLLWCSEFGLPSEFSSSNLLKISIKGDMIRRSQVNVLVVQKLTWAQTKVKGRCKLQADECDISRRPEGIVASHLHL